MQQWPSIRAHYAFLKQPTITYPNDVERLDAHDALARYKPTTVLGCWITERYQEGKKEGNMYGPDEKKLLQASHLQKYIVVGNANVHGGKEILTNPVSGWQVSAFRADWLYSRVADQTTNRIYIFSRQS